MRSTVTLLNMCIVLFCDIYESVSLTSFLIETDDPVSYYDNNSEYFGNKEDFTFYPLFLPTLDCCQNSSSSIIIGGLNAGQLLDVVLLSCPKVSFHGFEIQKNLYEYLELKYSSYPKVYLNNMGMSHDSRTKHVSNTGEGSGLYKNFRGSAVTMSDYTIKTISLSAYTLMHSIAKTCITIIDVEGLEVFVILGMHLKKKLELFPIFSLELGGTWAEKDGRNPSSWHQKHAAKYLLDIGYRIFLIGSKKLLEVNDSFFNRSKLLNEGYGFFVQGNLLAIHKSSFTLERSVT